MAKVPRHFVGWEGGGLRGTKTVNKHFCEQTGVSYLLRERGPVAKDGGEVGSGRVLIENSRRGVSQERGRGAGSPECVYGNFGGGANILLV